MLGWIMVALDNESVMLPQGEDSLFCKACGRKLTQERVHPDFRLRRRDFDLSETEDGYWIASKEFKEFCECLPFGGFEFVPLPSDPDFFWFRIHSIADYEPLEENLTREAYCRCCGAFASVEGLLEHSGRVGALPEGIHCSEFEYGRGPTQRPLMLLGRKIGAHIKARLFRGVYVKPMLPEGQPAIGPGTLLVKAS